MSKRGSKIQEVVEALQRYAEKANASGRITGVDFDQLELYTDLPVATFRSILNNPERNSEVVEALGLERVKYMGSKRFLAREQYVSSPKADYQRPSIIIVPRSRHTEHRSTR